MSDFVKPTYDELEDRNYQLSKAHALLEEASLNRAGEIVVLNQQLTDLQHQLAQALNGLTTAADLYKQARKALEEIITLTTSPDRYVRVRICTVATKALATPEPPRGPLDLGWQGTDLADLTKQEGPHESSEQT